MPEQLCPHCGKLVVVNAAGICTNCREPVAGPKQSIDPYREREANTAYSRKVSHQKSLAYQAARFSLIAPLVIVVLGGFASAMVAKPGADRFDGTGAMALVLTNGLLKVLGTIFGLLGVVLGARQRAWGTVAMGAAGSLMCGVLLLVLVFGLLG